MNSQLKVLWDLFEDLLTELPFGPDPKDPDEQRWTKLPDLDTYLATHPECRKEDPNKPLCYACGSDETIIKPVGDTWDTRQIHICTGCKRHLYRTESAF